VKFVTRLTRWFETNARDLPWRGASPWHVVVSEFMLQQTPVNRVLPVYAQWMKRWPIPSALAAESVSEAVREWGRLGYPRRAQRLHQAAVVIDRDFDDVVPNDEATLRTLPGVGEYTAAAISAFAFQQRSLVLDTNIRRVLARTQRGVQWQSVSITQEERDIAAALLPRDALAASVYNAAIMELGAIICTAARPLCDQCPVADLCEWNLSGNPHMPRPHRTQAWHGTDRQCRGAILQMLRENEDVSNAELAKVWDDRAQFSKCLEALTAEGFVAKTKSRWHLAN
jgi:A/G-specific adenine glycosylase